MTNRELMQAQMNDVLKTEQPGTGWYTWLFTQAPEARNFFKGAENVEPSKIPSSERFQKQGGRFLNKMSDFVNLSNNEAALRAEFASFVVEHRKKYKINEASWYEAIGKVWMGYVEKTVGMDDAQKAEWLKMFSWLTDEAKKQLDGA